VFERLAREASLLYTMLEDYEIEPLIKVALSPLENIPLNGAAAIVFGVKVY